MTPFICLSVFLACKLYAHGINFFIALIVFLFTLNSFQNVSTLWLIISIVIIVIVLIVINAFEIDSILSCYLFVRILIIWYLCSYVLSVSHQRLLLSVFVDHHLLDVNYYLNFLKYYFCCEYYFSSIISSCLWMLFFILWTIIWTFWNIIFPVNIIFEILFELLFELSFFLSENYSFSNSFIIFGIERVGLWKLIIFSSFYVYWINWCGTFI